MSKINATYSSGYYIAPDVDFRKLEEQQRQEQRSKRRRPGTDAADGGDDNVKRQTFAIPFDVICLHCNHRIARGSHVYANRRATEERYLGSIRVWELEILCRFCKGKYYLRTDPETPKDTGGYICVKGCKRAEGDFYALNKQNQAAREEWEKAKAEAELDPLAALEKENAAVRQLEEHNRQIEEEVERQAGHNDDDLLAMLRNRSRRRVDLAANTLDGDDYDEDAHDGDKNRADASADPSLSGLPPPPVLSSSLKSKDPDRDSAGASDVEEDAEDADERSFREFEEDMERRWRALEREQRAQRRREQESASAAPVVQESEVDRVLARYGGTRRGAPASTVETGGTAMEDVAIPSMAVDNSTAAERSNTTKGATASDAITATAHASARSNKFLIQDDDEGDEADLSWRAPRQPAAFSTRATLALSSSASGRVAQTHLGQSAGFRPGGSALLRNLIDSDSDDEDP
ncbi:Saf4/Yju2 protein [Lotmaria passim]